MFLAIVKYRQAVVKDEMELRTKRRKQLLNRRDFDDI